MQPLTFADRLDFAAPRAHNLFARRSWRRGDPLDGLTSARLLPAQQSLGVA